MGQANSKITVAVPTRVFCFPFVDGENDLVAATRSIKSSLIKAREILDSILNFANTFTPPGVPNVASILTVTSYLIRFALDRLCKENKTNNEKNNNTTTSCQPSDPKGQPTLEDALIQMKIDKAIAKASVVQLRAKLTAISNRFSRLLLTEINIEDRRLEVVPALTLCEEVLQLFSDANHVFVINPVISAPFIVSFGGVYLMIAELTLVLIPSYRVSLIRQMQRLHEVLITYKVSSILARKNAVRIKGTVSHSIIEGAMFGSAQIPLATEKLEFSAGYFIDDPYLKNSPGTLSEYEKYDQQSLFKTGVFNVVDSTEKAIATYYKQIEEKYEEAFQVIIDALMSFSGFGGIGAGSQSSTEVVRTQTASLYSNTDGVDFAINLPQLQQTMNNNMEDLKSTQQLSFD